MDNNDIIKEYGIEFAIEKLAPKIAQKIKEYSETKDEKIKEELAILIKDRDNIYSGDRETIKRYL